MDFTIIDKRLSAGQQDITLAIIAQYGAHKVRFNLKSDFYSFQSHATADVWSESTLSWNNVMRLRGEEMATRPGLANLPGKGGLREEHFAVDIASMQAAVRAILA